jgi:hypothetical protein
VPDRRVHPLFCIRLNTDVIVRGFYFAGEIMPIRKVKRRPWVKDDVRKFKKLAKAKTPALKIARFFKRTEGAIRQKALQLGVSLNSRA